MEGCAELSRGGRYRYLLMRVRHVVNPSGVLWIMLNPSTADAMQDDPTIRRCWGFTTAWHYDWMHVVNLFALRASDPAELERARDPVGPDNDAHIQDCLRFHRGPIVAAWGAEPIAQQRALYVYHALMSPRVRPMLRCLGENRDGSPKHPLYLRKDTELQPFTPRAR